VYGTPWSKSLFRAILADGRFDASGSPDAGTACFQASWSDAAIVQFTLPATPSSKSTDLAALDLIRQLANSGCPVVGWYPGTDAAPVGLSNRMMAAGCAAYWSGEDFSGLLQLVVKHAGVFSAESDQSKSY
jgi:hypothetical protein